MIHTNFPRKYGRCLRECNCKEYKHDPRRERKMCKCGHSLLYHEDVGGLGDE